MKDLTRLFRLLEITRAQPQYGYALAEIPKTELSDLAQHHYLVTFMAWRLARLVKKAGFEINVEQVLEISLIHDLGELFGGDIAMPYAMANPQAREAAKKFEAENLAYLATLFGDDKDYFDELATHAMKPVSLEALVAKIADYIEVTHYKLYVHRMSQNDVTMIAIKLHQLADVIENKKIAALLNSFITEWAASLGNGQLPEIFDAAKI